MMAFNLPQTTIRRSNFPKLQVIVILEHARVPKPDHHVSGVYGARFAEDVVAAPRRQATRCHPFVVRTIPTLALQLPISPR